MLPIPGSDERLAVVDTSLDDDDSSGSLFVPMDEELGGLELSVIGDDPDVALFVSRSQELNVVTSPNEELCVGIIVLESVEMSVSVLTPEVDGVPIAVVIVEFGNGACQGGQRTNEHVQRQLIVRSCGLSSSARSFKTLQVCARSLKCSSRVLARRCRSSMVLKTLQRPPKQLLYCYLI